MFKIQKLVSSGTKLTKALIKNTKKKQTVELYKMFKGYNPNMHPYDIKQKIAAIKVASIGGFSTAGMVEFAVKDQAHPEEDHSSITAKSISSMALGLAGYAVAGPLGGLLGSGLGYFSPPEFVKNGMKSMDVKS